MQQIAILAESDDAEGAFRAAREASTRLEDLRLLAEFEGTLAGAPLRLVGVTGYELVGRDEPEQLWLFDPAVADESPGSL